MRTFLLICCLLIIPANICIAFPNDNWFEAADACDLPDSFLIDHLDDPTAQSRSWAAYYLSLRWKAKDYIKLLKDNQKAGIELCCSSWPADGNALLDHFITSKPETDTFFEMSAYIVSIHASVDQLTTASTTAVLLRARVIWADRYFRTMRQGVVWTDEFYFLASSKRNWLRELFYQTPTSEIDGDWRESWGRDFASDRKFMPHWRLREYWSCLRIICNDPISSDERAIINDDEFLSTVERAVKSGRNECDIELFDDRNGRPKNNHLRCSIPMPDFGPITYAELVCVLLNRPDFIPAVQKRLIDIRLDPRRAGPLRPPRVITNNNKTPLVTMLALAAQNKTDETFSSIDDYFHDKWLRYDGKPITRNVPLAHVINNHPWMRPVLADKQFVTKLREAYPILLDN